MRIVVSIFCLPHEIDDLETTLNQLRESSKYISKNTELVLDITLSLSDVIVDWKKSSLPKTFFEEKLLKLSTNVDWCEKSFRTSTNICGCVSHRRDSLLRQTDATHFVWLDLDIIFPREIFLHLENSLNKASEETDYFVITSEIVRYWDESWDIIVNDEFLKKEINYQNINNPFIDSGIKGDISLHGVFNKIPNQPKYKFKGGWFTCISAPLLKRIGVPESFGHYGYEDTFLMWSMDKLSETTDLIIKQFKIKNLIVCENNRYKNNSHYLSNMSVFDRREQFKKISESNFIKELEKIK
jgi:hypothetical protein